ncbi:hypothetical protein BpHYR1_018529 [Brachionus plicatilis]|uniref:Uncharacterized protein n=1 Tax=Brachionus plicatilis TaxID=10195 RepID=A0A3M7RT35_BRAPC|nr:hypothetical protein BpHYR1_018529 [Brachionus plicatilis]
MDNSKHSYLEKLHRSIFESHLEPVKPLVHSHLKPSAILKQVPPLRHNICPGLALQKSTSLSHKFPV